MKSQYHPLGKGSHRDINYSTVPNQENPRMVASIKRYVEHGIRPGGFLTALFSNHTDAIVLADEKNYAVIREWVQWTHSQMPHYMVGSRENVEAYLRNA